MKKWIVKQRDLKDCGVSCLLSIIRYYDGNASIEALRSETFTNSEGTSAYHLIKTLKKYNFDAVGLKIELESINKINLPAIAHVIIDEKLSHFVVIYKINKSSISIMDPGRGLIKYSFTDWNKIFTGTVIICYPVGKIITIKDPQSISKLLKSIVNNEKKIIFKIITVSVILTICSIISSFYLKFTITSISQSGIYFSLKSIFLIFSLILIIKLFTTCVRSYYEIYLNKNIDLSLIIPFLKHLYRIPLSKIKSRSIGEITTRVYELNEIKELFTKIIISIFLDLLLALSALVILININFILSIIVCIILLLYGVFGLLFSPIIKRKATENIEKATEYNSHLVESVSMISSIKNIHQSVHFEDNLIGKLINYLNNTFRFQKTILFNQTIKEIINEVGMFILLTYGVYLISKGNLSVINLITFFGIVNYLTEPFKNIIDYLPKIEYIKATYFKLNDFINMEEEDIIEKEDKFYSGSIEIKNFSYSYDGYNNIIKNLNMIIRDKEKIMITGPSGSGKSTIFKSLMRLIDYDKGDILINEINIKDYGIDTLRKNICLVDQNETLMSDTIFNNILLNKKINTKDFNELMMLCKIDEIIKNKPLRYNTFLFEQGANLSGGEKQRIILARALVQNKKIIILDEALSQLSIDMEREIINNILKKYWDKTIIYITHRDHQNIFNRVINIKECYE